MSAFNFSPQIFISFVIASLVLISCGEPISYGPNGTSRDVSVVFCNDLHVHFGADSVQAQAWAEKGGQRLDGGRLLTAHVNCPTFKKQPRVWARVSLKSAGDPWDKQGALLLLSADKTEPAVELMRFFTPFGVGHYSDQERTDEYRPVYIPHWEDSVSWEVDVTHLLPLLQGDVELGVHVDTWTDEGYRVSARLDFEASKAQRHVLQQREVQPLLNTLKHTADQEIYTGFADGPVEVSWKAMGPQRDAHLHYIASGHGGHDGGDEFTPQEHVVQLDGEEVLRFTPWRDDCAAFRRFNPTSGVWTEPAPWKGDTIQERIASSDYSRSGWCPGSTAEVMVVKLGNLRPGAHTLAFEIPGAQQYTDSTQNFWNVSALLTFTP